MFVKYLLLLSSVLVFSCSEEPKSQSKGVASAAELSQAFLNTVYPVVRGECAVCHSDGAYPFASSIRTQASETGVGLMGSGLESNRYLNKVGDSKNPHPNQEVSTKAYPQLENAVKSFFSKVNTGIQLGKFISSDEVSVNAKLEKYPALNNLGFLLFEAEGATLTKNTKFEIASGSFQNSFAISSTKYPPSSLSGAARILTYNACDESPEVTLSQAAHTADKITVKYVFRLNTRLVDPVNGKNILVNGDDYVFNAIDVLPKNKIISSVTDLDYKTTPDPENLNFVNPLTSEQKNYILNILSTGAGKSASIKTLISSIVESRGINADNILSYLTVDSVVRFGGPRTLQPSEIQVHSNESVDLDNNLSQTLTHPGYADFFFSVPDYLSFGDIGPSEDLDFDLFTKSLGQFAVSIHEYDEFKKQLGEAIYPCRNENRNSALNWVRIGRTSKLKRGKSYRIRLHQTSETSKTDAFLLRVVTEENAGSINDDPSLTRFSSYGRYDNGEQKKIKKLQWTLPVGGTIEADVVHHSKFYEISSPIYIPDADQSLRNLQLTGVDFLINGQISNTDKSFREQGIRPPNAIISYGAVLIPVDKGILEDKIALAFDFLELTDKTASLPSYADAPPIEGIKCLAPEVFFEKVFPIYTQLPVILREDYDRWSVDSSYPYKDNQDDDSLTVPSLGGGQYKCVSCHDSEHPYFPIPEDYLDACDEALSRSNLDNPYLSFAIRGLRGQFEHPALYIAADITDKDKLRYVTIPGTEERVYYGPQTGKFKSYTLNEIENFKEDTMTPTEVSRLYNALQTPKHFYINPLSLQNEGFFIEASTLKPSENFFQFIQSSKSAFVSGPNTSVFRNDEAESTILDQHKQILDKLVESFVSWLEEEKKLRK